MPRNWSKITKVLSFKEKILTSFLLLVSVGAVFFWVRYAYLDKTVSVPKKGGEYAEGIVGQPIYINPLLSQTSEADSDLVQLLFSGLLRYDQEGNLINDLASGYEVSEDKKTYTFHIREDAYWHDGEKLTADDVEYTIHILQDPNYKSPIRQSWQGVEVRKTGDYTVEFVLQQPYFGFLSKLTLGILPQHVWENIAVDRFTLADSNLHPVGSGPYMFSAIQKDSEGNIASIALASNPRYHHGEPFISKIILNFYPDEDLAVKAYNNKEVSGLGNISLERIGELKNKKSTVEHGLVIPRYFALFLNQTKSIVLANDTVRRALALATNREEVIGEVLSGKGEPVYFPILPQMKAFNAEAEKNLFNLDKARELLENDGWKMNPEKGLREKDGRELKFKILTIEWPELSQTAALLAEQWKEIGAEAEIEILSVSEIQQNHIRPRDYEALLFGQENSFDPDLYPFWHSSQKQDPGFNLALFDNQRADTLLEEARQETNEAERIKKYQEFQSILAEKVPAIFLYSPYYIYPVSASVRGIDIDRINSPSGRFAEIDQWYINTRRVRK